MGLAAQVDTQWPWPAAPAAPAGAALAGDALADAAPAAADNAIAPARAVVASSENRVRGLVIICSPHLDVETGRS
jgi:hypothetical protein